MDSFYPEDILVGFFPLVFAVNTIPDGDPNGEIASEIEASSGKIYRSPFDRFLDAIAASLVDESDEEPVEVRRTGNRTIALFRGDDDETSDEEDILLQENCSSGRPQPRKKQGGFGFGRRSMSSDGPNGDLPTSYAKALTNGQGFFQRARIVTISTKYGFPPSKDPEGTNNLSFELHNLENRRTSDKEGSYQSLLKHYPVGGIIPSGWLDKHVHALPSAIMVVCAVSTVRKEQAEQDRLLFQTIEHLQYSLVPKRQCSILVVGLMKDDVTDEQGKEWCQAITHDLVLEDNANTPFTVTVLRASIDLQRAETDVPTSSALLRLKRTARDASLLYYLRQARRTKDKLSKLVGGKRKTGPPPLHLSPLIIRYCFKIAIFYEFQMKHEKSLRFMTEGYRSIVKYFQCLLVRPENISSNHKALNGGQKDDETIATDQVSSASVQDAGDSVEVELTSEEYHKGAVWSKPFPPPPEDILYQCLVVADWLNLKLLTAGFASHTEDGLIAASNQWRLHSRVFATARNSKNLKMDGWFEWAYICRQRIVTSQLVDRHPPTALGDVGNDFDEIILRCSPWLTYESASEAMLRLAQEIENARSTSLLSLDEQSEKNDSTRARFVGGLSTYGLRLEFVKECAINHREKALELMLRAISTFEHELVKHKRGFYAENEFSERSSSRTGARLYYVAGGILLGMHRHDEALSHLSKALRYSRGWRELELAVRRMLIECYDKHIPSPGESSESDTLVSMILDSYFNAEMSSQNLRKALDHFATISGGDTLKWYHETRNEEDTSLPFSFAVSFPGKTQATSGDVVEASVVIKSNLDYAVHVNSAALGTLAGKLPISAFDLLSAANANEGLDGGIIIQANSSIIISTKLELPRDISVIAFDESGNGGELLGVSGKGSFAKNAKPHSAGISAAGGARLVSENMLQRGNSNSQGWNLRFLGGKPLLCDGLHLTFYPVQAEKDTSLKITLIDLTIEKKKNRTAANIKRTPFEEENYIASAWSRPQHLPFSRGPRSIRVLGPQPGLVVTNVTDGICNGQALEGTVNRILLKLQSGPDEICSDLEVNVSCFSVLITPTGSTLRLVSKEMLTTEADSSVDMTNPLCRTPVLVNLLDSEGIRPLATGLGYDLPVGWQTAGTGHKYTVPKVSPISKGESTFFVLDLYRPTARSQGESVSGASADTVANCAGLGDTCICKTDFYITISYRQERNVAQSQKPKRTRRSSRKRPVMSSAKDVGMETDLGESSAANQLDGDSTNDVLYESVSLEFDGSLVWNAPMMAQFDKGARKVYPLGIRHPSNLIDQSSGTNTREACILGNEQTMSTRCTLELDPLMKGLKTEILSVRFEGNDGTDAPVSVRLTGTDCADEGQSYVIYKSELDDPSRVLACDTRLGISYTSTVELLNDDEGQVESASSPLGSILVDWKPSVLQLPSKVDADSDVFGAFQAHGPLALAAPSTIRFTGPLCYIERAPFEVKQKQSIEPHTVGVPFAVQYSIANTTTLHQVLRFYFIEDGGETNGLSLGNSGLLMSGCKCGFLWLGPMDEQCLSFTFVASRPGQATLPALQVSSDRYQNWVINDGPKGVPVFVFP